MALTASEFFDLQSFAHAALFKDCEYAWEALLHLKEYLQQLPLGRIEAFIPEGAYVVRPELVSIAEGCVIEPGAYIHGPCVIGAGTQVRHGAYIRGDVLIGENCVVGHASELKHSIFLDGAHAGHFAYVGDSILGNKVNLGAGVKCANLRLDRGEVKVYHEGVKYTTGMRKLGLLAGDGCQLGCNGVTNPGTLMGPRSVVAPCLPIGGVIPADSSILLAQSKTPQEPISS